MERVITEFMHTEPHYIRPYMNHYGYTNLVGYCDNNGKGNAFTELRKRENWDGSTIVSFNGYKTYFINGFVVAVKHIHGPWAMGEIINNDLTTTKCYIAKVNNNFVVAGSIKEVIDEMRQKIKTSLNRYKDIAMAFVMAHPNYETKYDWDEMVTWHSLDTASCADGRKRFSDIANKKSGDLATPKELISFMKESSSKEIAIEMERLYLNR